MRKRGDVLCSATREDLCDKVANEQKAEGSEQPT